MAEIISSGNYAYNQIVDRLISKGDIHLVNGTVQGIQTPTLSTDAASLLYATSIVINGKWKSPVIAGTTGAITLSGEQTIDGISVTSGDRVLVKNQASGVENGIYVVSINTWSRSSDLDTGTSSSGASMWIEQGSVNNDKAYVCTNDSGNDVVGTDSLTFVIFSASGGLNQAGDGIQIISNVISVDNTVILTSGGQTISGNLDVTGTTTAGTITDGTSTITGGDISVTNLTVTDQLFLTDTNQVSTSSNVIDGTQGNLNSQGSISLYNPTKNRIIYRPSAGSGNPTFTNRSDGTKIVLKPTISGTSPDIAIGVTTTQSWCTASLGGSIKFYAGTTEIMAIDTSTNTMTVDSIVLNTSTGNMSASSSITDTFTTIDKTIYMYKGSVTQLTSITTAVTLNRPNGEITTVSATTGAESSAQFQVNNTFITTTSIIKAQVSSYGGTQGYPLVTISGISAGSFDINLINAHPSLALDGIVTIFYNVFGTT